MEYYFYYSKVFASWIVWICSLIIIVYGQTDSELSMECMGKLLPCQPYLKSTSPPDSCCTPLQSMVDGDGDCLCQVFASSSILKSFDLTQDEALMLPKACGFQPDLSSCTNATSATSSPTSPATSSPTSPATSTPTTSPATPSGSSSRTSDDSNAADHGITYFGGNGFTGLLVSFFCFSILLNH